MADPVKFRKGTIVSFDQSSGGNVVEVAGANISNMSVLGVAEVASYVPGAQVGILVVDSGGSQSWFILGRNVRPFTSDYSDAINLLNNSIYSDQIDTAQDTTSTTFGDLTTIGPTAFPIVRNSGRVLVMVSTVIISDDTDVVGGGLMTTEVSGNSGIIYAAATLPNVGFYYSDNATHLIGDAMEATRMFLLSGLTVGDHLQVRAKYRAQGVANTTFSFRNVTCIAL